MINLDNLKIIRKKGSYNRINNLKSNITIRFHTNNKYEFLTVTFGELICEKFLITEHDKLELACDQNDNLVWYLVIRKDSDGYKISPAPRSTSLKCIIRNPFLDANPNKQCKFTIDDVVYYQRQRVLKLSVHNFFNNKQLQFKENFIMV